MERRVKVPKSELQKVYDSLKAEGFTLDDISAEIDSGFRNHLYSGTSIPSDSFEALKTLYDGDVQYEYIEYENGIGKFSSIDLIKNELTAELVGMILGDGHLSDKSYDRGDRHVSNHHLKISFSSEEEKIISRANYLIKECLSKEPSVEEFSHDQP
ncbi:hypothetical protein [Candidatus Nanohalovita haloferacivicina]|uniref:hypothetical protein n=1 Tax=Candidatus Nanohalovita haloferacivicina TaxID=2978046 RepID=UPI00325F96B5|nr:hypothetical protein HBNXNv_0973 [Candidatus Nanohalobia archaeon BNXNv]